MYLKALMKCFSSPCLLTLILFYCFLHDTINLTIIQYVIIIIIYFLVRKLGNGHFIKV